MAAMVKSLIIVQFCFMVFLILIMGETYALNNTNPQFTIWWRKHIIGNENKLK